MIGVDGIQPVIFTDADNTLWDTDGIFASAQLQLLKDVEGLIRRQAPEPRLEFVREIDQSLAERHHQGLRYPPRYLVTAASRALLGRPIDKALTAAWKADGDASGLNDSQVADIEQAFIENVRKDPQLLPGVREGLERLRDAGFKILVVSEGDRGKVITRLERAGLQKFIDRTIESPKHDRLFRRVLKLVGSPAGAWMVGDQLTRDIIPAQDAGLRTIYVPSRFRPRWETGMQGHETRTASSFGEAADIILAETP